MSDAFIHNTSGGSGGEPGGFLAIEAANNLQEITLTDLSNGKIISPSPYSDEVKLLFALPNKHGAKFSTGFPKDLYSLDYVVKNDYNVHHTNIWSAYAIPAVRVSTSNSGQPIQTIWREKLTRYIYEVIAPNIASPDATGSVQDVGTGIAITGNSAHAFVVARILPTEITSQLIGVAVSFVYAGDTITLPAEYIQVGLIGYKSGTVYGKYSMSDTGYMTILNEMTYSKSISVPVSDEPLAIFIDIANPIEIGESVQYPIQYRLRLVV